MTGSRNRIPAGAMRSTACLSQGPAHAAHGCPLLEKTELGRICRRGGRFFYRIFFVEVIFLEKVTVAVSVRFMIEVKTLTDAT